MMARRPRVVRKRGRSAAVHGLQQGHLGPRGVLVLAREDASESARDAEAGFEAFAGVAWRGRQPPPLKQEARSWPRCVATLCFLEVEDVLEALWPKDVPHELQPTCGRKSHCFCGCRCAGARKARMAAKCKSRICAYGSVVDWGHLREEQQRRCVIVFKNIKALFRSLPLL
jgi:hypothetical protein